MKFADISGAELLIEVLRAEGTDTVFGNGGATEIPMMLEFNRADDLRYVLGLQEGTVVGMAEGYSRATGKPAFVSLHGAVGVGNAEVALYNALTTRVPMVVTAGQTDLRHMLTEPLLSGDVAGMARPVVKWVYEVTHLTELAPALHRAYREAMTPPMGPVLVSIPLNVQNERGPAETGRPGPWPRPVAGDVTELVSVLKAAGPGELAVVLASDIHLAGAGRAAVALAESLRAPVWGTPFAGVNPFPTVHPLWRGYLPPTQAAHIREVLGGFAKVLHIGPRPFPVVHYDPEPMLPDTELLQVVATAGQLGSHRPVRAGAAGDLDLTLRALVRELGRDAAPAPLTPALRRAGFTLERPMPPSAAVDVLTSTLPADTLLVDEAWCISPRLRREYRTTESGRYFWGEGTGLGWAMPAAIGLSLGHRERVVCVVGDGSAMFCPQALWSAAEQEAPVTFVVVDNGSYLVVESQISARIPGKEKYRGTDLRHPAIDFAALATSMGVDGHTAGGAAEFARLLSKSLESGRPSLIHVRVAKEERK
ncbi:benzoylformate decarboxylase [Nonomuraea solani]|uniref:Benzoylformate decarboxylase n=1 Tax=Nonomuraea solani TaxID=1144553 RepID=A0A1H6EI05_9ACTN|nr:thiamine pyrophosphate-dependent enzyme [Nonomuraea solani]SEG96569.1 benzoylformate decarboxylase [Nonomuraea solani]